MPPTTGGCPGPPVSSSGRRDLARIGALVSDQARCQMLLALGDGRALSASVLAAEAGVTAATASSHLTKLTAGGLLEVEAAGRRRNYRLAGPEVGVLIEVLERLAPALPVGRARGERPERKSRALAGQVFCGPAGQRVRRIFDSRRTEFGPRRNYLMVIADAGRGLVN